MGKRLYGFYRYLRKGDLRLMVTEDVGTKKELTEVLRENGYRVVDVLNEKEVEYLLDEIDKTDRLDNTMTTIDVLRVLYDNRHVGVEWSILNIGVTRILVRFDEKDIAVGGMIPMDWVGWTREEILSVLGEG